MTNEIWDQVRAELLKVVGKNNFSAWIEPITFDRIDERTAHFHVPTNFIGSWVTNNFGDMILRHMGTHGIVAFFNRSNAETHVHDHGDAIFFFEGSGILVGFFHARGAGGTTGQTVITYFK